MQELYGKRGVDVHFQFRAKEVKDEAVAPEELLLYRDRTCPPDPQSSLPDRRQTGLAEQVLAALTSEFRLRTGDAARPLRSDNIVLGFLGSSGLLRDEAAFEDDAMRLLLAADKVLRGRADLGQGVLAPMRAWVRSLGCFLGFLHEDKLAYDDIRAAVDARLDDGAPAPGPASIRARQTNARSALTHPGRTFSSPVRRTPAGLQRKDGRTVRNVGRS